LSLAEGRDGASLAVDDRGVDARPGALDLRQFLEATDASDLAVGRAQREFDLALADDMLQPFRDPFP
jgi:hypothetical protein